MPVGVKADGAFSPEKPFLSSARILNSGPVLPLPIPAEDEVGGVAVPDEAVDHFRVSPLARRQNGAKTFVQTEAA